MINVRIEYNEMRYLFDPLISLKAKGIMALMVAYVNSNSSKKVFLLSDIRNMCIDGESAFNNALRELIDHKYVIRSRTGNGFQGSPWVFVLNE